MDGMEKGLFITFEGPDGSGKTTVSTAVAKRLQDEGYQVRYTREPGGSRISEKIRDLILDPENTDMDPRTEALLYAASRRQHLIDIVLPLIEEGVTVISDRFVDSSIAYQGYGRQIGAQEVYDINAFAIDNHMPVTTIFLNIPAEVGLQRIHSNRAVLDRLDAESADFHERVYDGYQKVIRDNADRMKVVDASRDVDEVIDEVYRIVKGLLNDRADA